jgi:hypothetical protein
MSQDDNRPFAQFWQELLGRQRPVEPIPFPETSLLTQPIPFRVGWLGYYLPLPSNTAAIVRSTKDQPIVYTEGGYKNLQEGGYTLQYIDISDRFFSLPKISAPALNSSEVSLKISIFYKVNDPTLVVSNSSPLKAFFSALEEMIKNFIMTHRYDELIGEVGNEHFIPNRQIIQHIKEHVTFKESCKAFWLKDVTIEERSGNYKLTNLKQERLVQENENIIQRENVIQKQGIAEKEKILAQTKAEQDIMIQEMQALSKANQSEIMKQARILDNQLDIMRRNPDLQQAQFLKIIEVKKQALETLLHLYTISGFPRDENDLKLMNKMLSSLSETPINTPEISPEQSNTVNDLSSTIINLISPKK